MSDIIPIARPAPRRSTAAGRRLRPVRRMAPHRLAAAAALGAALALALLLAFVPLSVNRIGGPGAWWLVPFVLAGLLSAGGLLVALAGG